MTIAVAIVGRPNVGKSTLFNRLVGKRVAIVAPQPGVTRDRREGAARLFDLTFNVIDTAGLEEADPETLEARMREQTERAVADADVALLLVDARAGVTPLDRHFAGWLRRTDTPVILVANKCEGTAGESGHLEAFGLGLGDPVPVSAEHGLGLSDLRDALATALETAGLLDAVREEETEGDGEAALQLAVVGRPNVGKSTLVNRLVGEERVLTGPEAGITRDAVAVEWSYGGRPLRLVDTAGLRRRARVTGALEKLSASDTMGAVQYAHVVILLVEADAPMEKQDLTIAARVEEEGRALVVAVNKWDVCADRAAALSALRDRLERSLPQTRGLPVVPISALRGDNLSRLMDAVFSAYEVWNRRIPTSMLNRWLAERTRAHPPPAPGGRPIKMRYITQAKARPPTFALFCSKPSGVPNAYVRYLENALRQDFDLPGTPVRLNLRKGDNPYAKDG